MEVILVDAKGLQHTDFLGKIDPYVMIQYRNQKYTSKTARDIILTSSSIDCVVKVGQGSRPVWNEEFKFRVEYPTTPARDDQNYKVFLQIMDRDSFTQDDYLGQTTIYLKELFEEGMEKGKVELGTQKYRVVSSDGTYHGEIQVAITFTAMGRLVNKRLSTTK
ncbi:hypothetical protein DH2020_022177 [Rehmannia glutinosa]|uniref:C2 domain-containing protein n=1 Tax=Rehmannia glutinosa TaxID=99300 RepID=A0ABR0WD38_REHGL